jgi:Ricin-type beta-trefoil lectin domain
VYARGARRRVAVRRVRNTACMRFRSRRQLYAEIRLPGITVGTDDVGALFKQGRDAGPFLVISRCCGLALDTAFAIDHGSVPILWPPHGRRQQIWNLRPSGCEGQVLLVSAENGLALDSTRDPNGGKPVLWEEHGEVWQRWSLQQSSDGVGYLIESALSSRVLAASEDAQPRWQPWLADRDGGWSQQWLLSMPHGHKIG